MWNSFVVVRHGYWLILAGVFIVTLPILWFGFFGDDYYHLATLENNNPLASPYDLFLFGTGDYEITHQLYESGFYP